jgi:predicted Zn-dependent protease
MAVLARRFLNESLDCSSIVLYVTDRPLWVDGSTKKSGAVDYVREDGKRRFLRKAIISTEYPSLHFRKSPNKRRRYNTRSMLHQILHSAYQLENCVNPNCIMAPSSVPSYHGRQYLGCCPSCEEKKEDFMLTR